MKKALITGITGQDGADIAEFLLKKSYEVLAEQFPKGTIPDLWDGKTATRIVGNIQRLTI